MGTDEIIGGTVRSDKLSRSEYGESGVEEYSEIITLNTKQEIAEIKVTKFAPVTAQGFFLGISAWGDGNNKLGSAYVTGSEAIRVAEDESIIDYNEEFTNTNYLNSQSHTGIWGTTGSIVFKTTGSWIQTGDLVGSFDYQLSSFNRITCIPIGSITNNLNGSVVDASGLAYPITLGNFENGLNPVMTHIKIKINSSGNAQINRLETIIKGTNY